MFSKEYQRDIRRLKRKVRNFKHLKRTPGYWWAWLMDSYQDLMWRFQRRRNG